MSETIKYTGLNRILIEEHEAVHPDRAIKKGIFADIAFRRGDGWSLGCPKNLENHAHMLWEKEWTHYAIKGDQFWRPIKEYK